MQTRGTSAVRARFLAYGAGHYRACVDGSRATAEAVTAYDKGNHRWQNRTGQAEATIHCAVDERADMVRLVNQHGVPYGEYLERERGGSGVNLEYAILLEALRAEQAAWLEGITQRVRALQ